MKKIILATLGMGLLAVGFNASAATATTTIAPTLSISGACTLDASAINATFTEQAAGSTAAGIEMAGGNLKVVCEGQNYVVAADNGVNPTAGTLNQRNLKATGATLIPYKLTIDDGATGSSFDWGDAGLTAKVGAGTDEMTDAVTSIVLGSTAGETFVVGGTTTATLDGTEVSGTYTDTVTITVAW